MLIRIFTAQRQDIEFKRGFNATYSFEIQNDDCTARDFTDSEGVFLRLRAKEQGKILANIELTEQASPNYNFYDLEDDTIPFMRGPRTYYYEVYSMEGSPAVEVLLFWGNAFME